MLVLIACGASAQSSFRSVNYTKLDGLPHNVVTCLFQDSRGYLWVGTLNGLAKYDGYNFTTYRRKAGDSNSLSGSIVTAITEDKLGNLWVGTQNDGLNKRDGRSGLWQRFTTEQQRGLTENYITALTCDSAGTVWIGTPHRLDSL